MFLNKKDTLYRMISMKKTLIIITLILTSFNGCLSKMNTLVRFPQWTIKDKRVLLRADLNVPIIGQQITDDFRLQAIQPTLDALLQEDCTVILLTHIGRPKGYNKNLSTQILVPWFEQHGYTIAFAKTIGDAAQNYPPKTIVLLENLRFFAGEQASEHVFAQQLATLGDYYVNDAFGTLHRNDTSIALLPQELPLEHCSAGLLVQEELKALDKLLHNPQKPFVVCMGGGKASTKLPIIENLLNAANTILLCPAIVFTFAKALDKQVGKSMVDDTAIDLCKKIMHLAEQKNVRILFPLDYQVAHQTINGALSITPDDEIPSDYIGISIGPKTIERFGQEIESAGTIFFNGEIGFADKKETRQGMNAIFNSMAQADGMSIIAGGDSVAAAHHLGIAKDIDRLSTGGGATLAYLSGQKLPGVESLKYRAKT